MTYRPNAHSKKNAGAFGTPIENAVLRRHWKRRFHPHRHPELHFHTQEAWAIEQMGLPLFPRDAVLDAAKLVADRYPFRMPP